MARLTPWPFEAARKTVAEHGLELARVEPLDAGSVNSNFRLTLADGRQLFARLYEEQAEAGARAELAVLDALVAAGVPTPRPLERPDGEVLSAHAGKPLALFAWVEGTIRCQKSVRSEDCRALGAALARVHRAVVPSVPSSRFGIRELEERLDRIEQEASAELAGAAREIRARLRTYVKKREQELPRGLIHGDLFRDNVLWNDRTLAALLDFESAGEGPFVYDLCVCVHAWCYSEHFEPELVSALVSGYDSERRLEDREIAAVRVEAALAALRFAITRITDYSMRASPGAAPLRDYRRFVARLEAVESGALDRAFSRLR